MTEPLSAVTESLQHRISLALGVNEIGRSDTVLTMLENNRRRAPGYWIQLSLAMAIATLGLVLGSTAVVIGAMLVSPLMGPILELGMGFAVGSPYLVIRASFRVVLSVLVVVLGAMVITLALPFHEVTAEISARTAPTALDLLVAMFCALTAAYTTVRPASDTTSAAAGTAIGIALVPPLCVCGFGLGTGSMSIAGGAALLFTANISGILVLAVASFLLLGFNRVDAMHLESGIAGTSNTRMDRAAARAEAKLQRLFGSRYGLAMRLIVPIVFAAAVYLPLSRALDEVAWEVHARKSIRSLLDAQSIRPVQTTLSVEHHRVDVALLLIGSGDESGALEKRLESGIAAATGVVPTVVVTTVPDLKTLNAITERRTSTPGIDPERINEIRQALRDALAGTWPAASAGPLVGWELVVPASGPPSVVVRHIGAPLGETGLTLLDRLLATRSGVVTRSVDAPMSEQVLIARAGEENEWLGAVRRMFVWLDRTNGTSLCLTGPASKATAASRTIDRPLRELISGSKGRAVFRDSSRWTARVVAGSCSPRDAPAPPR